MANIQTIIKRKNELGWNALGASTRYGYNGTHEQDKELNTDGNYLDFGNFGYDTRVAMRRNQEPLRAKYPHLSNYSIFNSNPILFSDPDGLKWEKPILNYHYSQGFKVTYNIKMQVVNDSKILTGNLLNKDVSDYLNQVREKTNAKLTKDNGGTFANPVMETNVTLTNESDGFKLRLFDAVKDSEGFYYAGFVDNIGNTQNNVVNLAVTRNGKTLNPDKTSGTLSHELPHTPGLRHSFDDDQSIPDMKQSKEYKLPDYGNFKNNIMNSYENPNDQLKSNRGSELKPSQKMEILKNVLKQTK